MDAKQARGRGPAGLLTRRASCLSYEKNEIESSQIRRNMYKLKIGFLATLVVSAGAFAPVKKFATYEYVVAAEGNEARYRIREQLAGFDFPNDAIGKTTSVTGTISFDAKGNVMPAESKILVDVTKLTSDKERRDGYVQRRTLETETHPTVTLVPTKVSGLSFPLPKAGKRTFEMVADLTVRGVTRPTTWKGEVNFVNGKITGTAATSFTFEQFSMTKPSVRSVLSVDDTIKLEYDFTFVPAAKQ
jgi:polyisoprenoid-binding protein YceI